jgi:hypothetical protein
LVSYILPSLIVLWCAHVYSELLGDWNRSGEKPGLVEARLHMREEIPMVGACALPIVVLLAGSAGLVQDLTAVNTALSLCAGELALAGFAAARRGGANLAVAVASGLVALGFGISLIIFKSVLH